MAWQKRDLVELMENMLNTAQQCGLETWKTNNIHGCISNNIISLKNIGILSLFSELVRLCSVWGSLFSAGSRDPFQLIIF